MWLYVLTCSESIIQSAWWGLFSKYLSSFLIVYMYAHMNAGILGGQRHWISWTWIYLQLLAVLAMVAMLAVLAVLV